LDARWRNFDKHISDQKDTRRKEEFKRQDLEDDLTRARKTHVELISQQGELQAEAKVSIITALSDGGINHMTGARATHI
jgi:DNA repair protein RAD50